MDAFPQLEFSGPRMPESWRVIDNDSDINSIARDFLNVLETMVANRRRVHAFNRSH